MKISENLKIVLCDDIRYEMGGKISMMGVFPREIIIKEPPFAFQKLMITIMFEKMREKLNRIDAVIKTPGAKPVRMKLPLPNEYQLGADLNLFMSLANLKIEAVGVFEITILLPEDDDIISQKIYQIKTLPMNN